MRKNPMAWIAMLVCGMALSGCAQPEKTIGTMPVPTLLSASIAQPTRTEIVAGQNPHPIYWEVGDVIAVHFDTDTDATTVHWYQLQSGAGTTNGTFAHLEYGGDTLPATYNSLIAGFSGYETISFNENTEMVLEARSEIFMGLDSVEEFPMHGTAAAGAPIAFRCSFGIAHIPVTGNNVSITQITMDTHEEVPVAGIFNVNVATDATTFVQSTAGSAYQIVWAGRQAVTLTDTPTDFYGVMPVGTYNAGTTLTFTLSNGSTIVKTAQQPFTVSRAQILNLPTLNVAQ